MLSCKCGESIVKARFTDFFVDDYLHLGNDVTGMYGKRIKNGILLGPLYAISLSTKHFLTSPESICKKALAIALKDPQKVLRCPECDEVLGEIYISRYGVHEVILEELKMVVEEEF